MVLWSKTTTGNNTKYNINNKQLITLNVCWHYPNVQSLFVMLSPWYFVAKDLVIFEQDIFHSGQYLYVFPEKNVNQLPNCNKKIKIY